MRGQAFIIYKDINSAMEARRKLNSTTLYGKTMVIFYSFIYREYNSLNKNQTLLQKSMVHSK
jgi:hypothetical protein